jgi:hypothetical protein
MKDREQELNAKLKEKDQSKQTQEQKSNYFGYNIADINRMGGNIPGFSTLRDRVLKPMMLATEKVVEYYYNTETQQNEPVT